MPEILTIMQLAEWLQMTPAQVYSMTRARARARMDHPLPILRINGNLRFCRADIEEWLEKQREAA